MTVIVGLLVFISSQVMVPVFLNIQGILGEKKILSTEYCLDLSYTTHRFLYWKKLQKGTMQKYADNVTNTQIQSNLCVGSWFAVFSVFL
jgi:hypothetical protein